MTNRCTLVLMGLLGFAGAMASCSSDDDLTQGAGGAESAGTVGRTSGGATSTAGRGGSGGSTGGTTAAGARSGGAAGQATSAGGVTSTVGGAGGVAGAAAGATVGGKATGGGGNATAGNAGSKATGGVAGSAAGNSATGGAITTAGNAGVAGEIGAAGSGATAGAAGGLSTAGTAGTGSTVLTTAQKCQKVCADQLAMPSIASCSITATACEGLCNSAAVEHADNSLFMAMLDCEVSSMSSNDYQCSNQTPYTPPTDAPAPKVNGAKTSPCAAVICAYTCAEIDNFGLFGDGDVYDACACP